MLKDELESMLTEELSIVDLSKRLNIPPTSIINTLYDLHQEGRLSIFMGPDKEIRYKLVEHSTESYI